MWGKLTPRQRAQLKNEIASTIEEGVSVPTWPSWVRKMVGAYTHVLHKSEEVDATDAQVLKKLLLLNPSVNTATQLALLTTMVERGLVHLEEEETNSLRKMLKTGFEKQLLTLATAAPHARPKSARKM